MQGREGSGQAKTPGPDCGDPLAKMGLGLCPELLGGRQGSHQGMDRV